MKKSVLKIICAWCGKDMGEKNNKGLEGVSHGICDECSAVIGTSQVELSGSELPHEYYGPAKN